MTNKVADSRLEGLDYGLLPELVGHQLRHGFNRGQLAFRAVFGDLEVSPLQYMAMELVVRNPGIGHAALSAALSTASSVMTTTLKPLLQSGRLSAERDAADGRVMRYSASEAGRDWYETLRPRITESEGRLLARLTSAERHELLRLLELLTG